ncbi:DUF3012 domain-containing protein [Photobacterium damselae subsp. damselae]|uniref:DUF3012 domain-containing protein n=1 Tax=Photobacterium damselae TaxID=38293 RepID=UPI000A2F96B0|nr:DUF3012 domain-containing protein [Photobacterium damselae]ARR49626.1 DUF3012 domain-containing protein [Photobacterium damselae subsp. damselae]QAY35831.1 DUF3012 domain-containing protein [Photobacterium damselae subsp. damselae]QOQ69518.1 DUF3012 domain-containing protein [Photobacterium damselae subsp. damselae]
MKKLLILLGAVALLSACSPKVGSEEWCTQLKEKPKGDWTANEVGEFAKSCIIRFDDQSEK